MPNFAGLNRSPTPGPPGTIAFTSGWPTSCSQVVFDEVPLPVAPPTSLAEPWILGGLVIGAGIYALYAVLRWFGTPDRQRRAMRRVPVVKLNEAELGATVRIVGRVRAQGLLLQSPLERRECCAYRLLVWDASGEDQQLVLDGSDFCELDVEADGVLASIRSPNITLEGRGDLHYSGRGDRPTGVQALIIERYGLDPNHLTYREYVLCPGDLVTVIAKVSCAVDESLDDARFRCVGSGGYRSKPLRRVLVADKFPLTVVAPGGEL